MKPLVLASQSPRRVQLLRQVAETFDVVPADIDETPYAHERPGHLVRRLAATKAVTVGTRYADALIVGADTVVVLDGRILGKPRDPTEAEAMLSDLSGRRHQVVTAVAVWNPRPGRGGVVLSWAHVTFRAVSALEIRDYVASGEPLDKAGAYAIQGGAGRWVAEFAGSLETVMGLPLDVVQRLLALWR